MFADESLLHEENEAFGGVFNEWRVKRVRKLEYVFGQEWFKGKKVLELACGFGNVGLYLKSLGAEVTFTDARKEALDVVKQKDSTANVIQLDQEKKWLLPGKYDLVLHFGLLYNLNNWEQDLECAVQHGQFTALETAVARYIHPFELKIVEPKYPYELYGPYSGKGTLVSAVNIEMVLDRLMMDYHRYDDADLNMNKKWDEYLYDWPEEYGPIEEYDEAPTSDSWDSIHLGGRRFWIIRNNNVFSSLGLLYR